LQIEAEDIMVADTGTMEAIIDIMAVIMGDIGIEAGATGVYP